MADPETPTAPESTEVPNEPMEGEQEPEAPAAPPAPTIYLPPMPIFGKYPLENITVGDQGIARYINLNPTGVPHHSGRHANTHFAKMKLNVVERLINHMMRTENWTGKKLSAYKVVSTAFDTIATKTKENPVQVFINAIVAAAVKEETTRLKYGGISVPKAVDTAPQRRVDLSIRYIAQGAVQTSHRNPKPIADCLADEIIKASKGDITSFAIAKKDDIERVAKSAR